MYDIHTHLYWDSYDKDREEVLKRAKEAGVEKMIVVGCTVDESRQAIELAEKYPELYASVGVHPHEFNKRALQQEKEELKKLVQNSKKVIAIGECGLDYFSHEPGKVISDEQKKNQREGFLAQIELAKESELPLIVHCRDAYRDMFAILQSANLSQAAVLHCYMGDTEVTKQFLTLPTAYFSFTANITYPIKKTLVGTKDDLTETVKLIPLDRIFTETDCPFLSPQEKRGERNEPAYVTSVVQKVAQLKGVSTGELEEIIHISLPKVFKRIG